MAKVNNHDLIDCLDLKNPIDLSNFVLWNEFCQLSQKEQLAILKENYGIMAVPVFLLRRLQMRLK